ncbi:unnamed protein product, partial [Allacma fusca]
SFGGLPIVPNHVVQVIRSLAIWSLFQRRSLLCTRLGGIANMTVCGHEDEPPEGVG